MRLLRSLPRALFGLFVLLLSWVGVHSLVAQRVRYPVTGVTPEAPAAGLRGAYHVHSTDSDGRGSVEEIARAAKKAGLDFVVLTDHNQESLPVPRFVDGVLFLAATELSTPWGHVVALGADGGISSEERKEGPIEAIQARGGRAVLAHPVQRRNPWRDWDAGVGADGLELYSGDTFWRRALERPGLLACAAGSYLAQPLHGVMVMVDAQADAVAALEGLVPPRKPVLGLCAHDAHGMPSYEVAFAAMATHLASLSRAQLSSSAEIAGRQVMEALLNGGSYCAFDGLGSATGFAVERVGPDGASERALQQAPLGTGETLRLRLPALGAARHRVVVSGPARLLDEGGAEPRLVLTGEGRVLIRVELEAPGCLGERVWRPWIVAQPLEVVE